MPRRASPRSAPRSRSSGRPPSLTGMVERNAVDGRIAVIGRGDSAGTRDPTEHPAVVRVDIGQQARNALTARAADQLTHQPAPDAAALPLIVEGDRNLRRVRVVRQHDVARDAHDPAAVGRYRGERLVLVMVDPREPVEVALTEPSGQAVEPAAPRLLAETRERLGQPLTVCESECAELDVDCGAGPDREG